MNDGMTKQEIRAEARARRLSLSEVDRASRSLSITRRVVALPEIKSAQVIHVYASMRSAGEVETDDLISRLRTERKRIVLPRILNLHDPVGGLEHREWDGSARLHASPWGVREPQAGRLVPPSEIDVVIVPMLAADTHGNRIGYGKGYYDAFIRDIRAVSIGLAYGCCLFDRIPTESHDVPVDIVVTEMDTIRRAP